MAGGRRQIVKLTNSRDRSYVEQPASSHNAPAETFDRASGQVFVEQTLVTAAARSRRHAFHPARPTDDFVHREPRGASSLEAMALRQFIKWLKQLSGEGLLELVDVLQTVPWHVARKIQSEAMRANCDQPLVIWTAFRSVYKDSNEIPTHRGSIGQPEPGDLPLYISRMNSNSFDWIVNLTLTHPNFHRSDIINLANLRNLAVLDIGYANNRQQNGSVLGDLVSDTVIRAWSREAKENGAFPKLRALLVRDEPEVTHLSLSYLSSFPALVLFGVQGCFKPSRKTRAVGESYGWTTDDHNGIMSKVQRDIERSETWDGVMTACYKHCGSIATVDSTAEPAEKSILSFRLGMTHTSVLMSNVFDKMTFYRAISLSTPTDGVAVPQPQSAVPLSSSSKASHTPDLPNSRPALRRKSHLNVADVLQEDFGIPRNAVPPQAPEPSTVSRRSMPPPPSAPIRATSIFNLSDMVSATAPEAQAQTRTPSLSREHGKSNEAEAGSSASSSRATQELERKAIEYERRHQRMDY